MAEWVAELFKAIDRKDAEGFVGYLAEDARFKFGSAPVVSGKNNIRNVVNSFFSSVKSLEHRIESVWQEDGAVICEGEVTYVKPDDKKLILPFANILRMKDGLVADYRIYIDMAPFVS